jgi:hypothetical protein
MNDEMIRQYVRDILELAESVKDEPNGDFKDGKLLAYNEVLSVLKTDLTPAEPEKYGLGFDIDKRLA